MRLIFTFVPIVFQTKPFLDLGHFWIKIPSGFKIRTDEISADIDTNAGRMVCVQVVLNLQ